MNKRLFVLDVCGVGHWLGHKHETMQREHNGEPCEMIDAFEQWLLELLTRFEPSHAAACLEGRNNWRKDTARGGAADYKSNRKPLDPRLKSQLDKLPALIRSLGVHCVRHEDNEADDIAATLVAQHASNELPVVLVSGDKDWSQLLGDNVTLFSPVPDRAKGETHLYDCAAWEAKTQIPPHRMPEFLALVGDSSDFVAGVNGWGAVAATNAIVQTRSWAELERKARAGQLQKIPTKKQAALIEQLPAFHDALRLVTLRYDVPLTETLDALAYAHPSEHSNSAEHETAGDDYRLRAILPEKGAAEHVAEKLQVNQPVAPHSGAA